MRMNDTNSGSCIRKGSGSIYQSGSSGGGGSESDVSYTVGPIEGDESTQSSGMSLHGSEESIKVGTECSIIRN